MWAVSHFRAEGALGAWMLTQDRARALAKGSAVCDASAVVGGE